MASPPSKRAKKNWRSREKRPEKPYDKHLPTPQTIYLRYCRRVRCLRNDLSNPLSDCAYGLNKSVRLYFFGIRKNRDTSWKCPYFPEVKKKKPITFSFEFSTFVSCRGLPPLFNPARRRKSSISCSKSS